MNRRQVEALLRGARWPERVEVDVREHRAPTADDARLLRELEREAADRVCPLGSNLISGRVTTTRRADARDMLVRLEVVVNGERLETTFCAKDQEQMVHIGLQEAANLLAKRIAGEIAAAILRKEGR